MGKGLNLNSVGRELNNNTCTDRGISCVFGLTVDSKTKTVL